MNQPQIEKPAFVLGEFGILPGMGLMVLILGW